MTGSLPSLFQIAGYRMLMNGALGVQLFFVVSGYCIANAAVRSAQYPKPVTNYAFARFRRIYPPYILTVILAFGISIAAAALVRSRVLSEGVLARSNVLHHGLGFYAATLTLTMVPFHVAPIPVLSITWTLCYEVSFYALVGIALLAVGRRDPSRMILMLHGVTIVALCMLLADRQHEWVPFPFDLLPEFGLGILVYDCLAQPTCKKRLTLLACAVALGLVYVMEPQAARSWSAAFQGPSFREQWLFSSAFALLLILLYRWDRKIMSMLPAKFLAWVGSFSYTLYLTHLIVLGLVLHISRRFEVTAGSYWILVIIQAVASVAAARALFVVIERPFLTKGKGTSNFRLRRAPVAADPVRPASVS
jgi:exopolysaccharide production protein ExoZ